MTQNIKLFIVHIKKGKIKKLLAEVSQRPHIRIMDYSNVIRHHATSAKSFKMYLLFYKQYEELQIKIF